MMSRNTGLWVLVEGRITDAPFYDRLLHANAKAVAVGFDVRLVETLKLGSDFAATGGKQAALKLFDHFKRTHKLTQWNSVGPRRIVFMLDRDLDFLTNTNRRSDHVIYTSARDTEAEAHINGVLPRALGSALSLTTFEATQLATSLGDHVTALADDWSDWIRIGVLVAGLRPFPCSVRPGKVSSVNTPLYGPVDPTRLATAEAAIVSKAQVQNVATRRRFLENRVAAMYARGEQAQLVKGKWLSGQLVERSRRVLPAKSPVDFNGLSAISKLLLQTLDFSAPWADSYHQAIDRVA